MTELTVRGHACVTLHRGDSTLVIDPGTFSDTTVLDEADAVLVTHEHPDHVDAGPLVQALADRPGLDVWGPSCVVDVLVTAGAARERLHAVHSGDRFDAAGFAVDVLGEQHAVIHPDVPRIANVAYLLDGAVLHPGDSFTVPPEGSAVQVMLVPVSAPWLKISEAVDHVRAVAPRVAVPIHDALLSDIGTALVDRLVGSLGHAGEYRRLERGELLRVEP